MSDRQHSLEERRGINLVDKEVHKHTKNGITRFVQDVVRAFQKSVLTYINNLKALDTNVKCFDCSTQNVVPCPIEGTCSTSQTSKNCNYHEAKYFRPCPKGICDEFRDVLIRRHRKHHISWKNTDARKWCSHSWEVAKCFIPDAEYGSVQSAEDTDLYGIICIVLNLKDFQKEVKANLFYDDNIFRKVVNSFDHLKENIPTVVQMLHLVGNYENAREAIMELQKVYETVADTPGTALQKYLIKRYMNLTKVPIDPRTIDSKNVDLNDVYVKPSVRIVLQECTNEMEVVSLESYRSLFFKDSNPYTKIYIIGTMGTGKSALCKMLTSTWCSAHSKWLPPRSEDERTMAHFDFLFYISLRDVPTDDTIENMIMKQFLKPAMVQGILPEDKCLVILDGLDGCVSPSNPGRSLKETVEDVKFHNYTFLFTSRPWLIEELKISPSEIEHHIQMDGFTVETSKEFTKNIVTQLNDIRDSANEFEKELERLDLQHLRNIPVLLQTLICHWHYEESIPKTRTLVYVTMIEDLLKLASNSANSALNELNANINEHRDILPARLELPLCFGGRELCEQFSSLIFFIARAAFEISYSQNQNVSLLVKNEGSIPYMYRDAVKGALNIGLVSIRRCYLDNSRRCKQISFIDESFQQFLSAVYVSSSKEIIKNIDKMFIVHSDVNEVIPMKTVYLCIGEMSKETARSLYETAQTKFEVEYANILKGLLNIRDTVLPVEIGRMTNRSIEIYKQTLDDGTESVHRIRVIVVGNDDKETTSLIMRLCGDKGNISANSKDGNGRKCRVNLPTVKWRLHSKDNRQAGTVTYEQRPTEDPGRSNEDCWEEIIEEAEVSFCSLDAQNFYTQQLFLSGKAIYLLVTDVSRDNNCLGNGDNFDISDYANWKLSENVDYWLSTIQSEACGQKTPPVIVVGTKDVSGTTENTDCRLLVNKTTSDKSVVGVFLVDNKINDPRHEHLKQKIMDVAKQQSFWKESIPSRWMVIEQEIKKQKQKGNMIIRREMLADLCVPLKSEELDVFLKFHHERGNIMYFSNEPELKDYILLERKLLEDALQALFTVDTFSENKESNEEEWSKFKETDVLKRKLIDAIWKKKSTNVPARFYEHREHIIRLLKKLAFIVKPLSVSESTHAIESDEEFLVPGLLQNDRPTSMTKLSDKYKSITTLCYSCSSATFTCAIYTKLVILCMSKWPLASISGRYCIYRRYTVFDLNKTHKLTLYMNSQETEIQMYVSFDKTYRIDLTVTTDARQFIEKRMCLHKFKTSIKCPLCSRNKDVDRLKRSTFMKCGDDVKHLLEYSSVMFGWHEDNDDAENSEGIKGRWKDALRNCHDLLVSKMSPDILLDIVVKACIFPDVVISDIRNMERMTTKNREIIKTVAEGTYLNYLLFKDCLKEAKQRKLVTALENEEQEEESFDWTEALRRCYPNLVEFLDIDNLLDYLVSKQILHDILIADIRNHSRSRGIRTLIDELMKRDFRSYQKFKECLVLSGQEELKRLLEREERTSNNTTVDTATQDTEVPEVIYRRQPVRPDHGKTPNNDSDKNVQRNVDEQTNSSLCNKVRMETETGITSLEEDPNERLDEPSPLASETDRTPLEKDPNERLELSPIASETDRTPFEEDPYERLKLSPIACLKFSLQCVICMLFCLWLVGLVR